MSQGSPDRFEKNGSGNSGYNKSKEKVLKKHIHIGTPGRIRTYDLWVRTPLLYPAELPGPGAGAENRTPITSLENWDNSRYTTPAGFVPAQYTRGTGVGPVVIKH